MSGPYLMGAQILVTCSVTQLFVWGGETRLFVIVGLWRLHVALIPPIILFVHRRTGVQMTAETCIWWIWASFIVCGSLVAVSNHTAGLPLFFTAPVLALLAAFAFSMMAKVTHRLFFLCAALLLLVMVATSLFSGVQSLIYGGSWFAVLVGLFFRVQRSYAPTRRRRCETAGLPSALRDEDGLSGSAAHLRRRAVRARRSVAAARLPIRGDGTSYVSIVVGNMRGMRPGPIPQFLGTNYYQIVHRAVVY